MECLMERPTIGSQEQEKPSNVILTLDFGRFIEHQKNTRNGIHNITINLLLRDRLLPTFNFKY